jgi:adenosylhomocysteine nucleosidase
MHKRIFILTAVLHVGIITLLAQAPVVTGTTIKKDSIRKYNPVTGILGAFPPEVSLLYDQLLEKKEHIIQHIRFTEGILNGRKVILAQTGIGKVNAAITTTLLLEHFKPGEVIFTGIAGAVDPTLSPGDIVIGTNVAHHDYGTLTPDSMLRRPTRNPFTMQENPVYFPCDSQLINTASIASKNLQLQQIGGTDGKHSPHIIKGKIVTGDVFVASSTATTALFKKMQAAATEMEGAAVGQVCWQEQVPFIVIRSMSDRAGNNASAEVKNFYEVAAYNSAQLVMAIMKILKN